MHDPNTCDCCKGLTEKTPVEVFNRPGLSAVSYRIGTYHEFRESMLARLSTSKKEALKSFTSRSQDDFSIGLIDAWATVSDVLTFYQERIVNESYLRTATEQLSVSELANLIGYQLRPGVAATTYLAFTLEETNLPSGQALISGVASGDVVPSLYEISAGTKVQSIPGQDELPQIFETIETIQAKVEWNAMRPRMSAPHQNLGTRSSIFVKGTDNDLKVGNIILVNEGGNATLRKIQKLKFDETEDLTEIIFSDSPSNADTGGSTTINTYSVLQAQNTLNTATLGSLAILNLNASDLYAYVFTQNWPAYYFVNAFNQYQSPPALNDGLFVFRKKASPFGYNAPKIVKYPGPDDPEPHTVPLPADQWDDWSISGKEVNNKIYLDSVYEKLSAGSYIAIQKEGQSFEDSEVITIDSVEERGRSDYGISVKCSEINFTPGTYSWSGSGNTSLEPIRSTTIHIRSEELTLTEVPIKEDISGGSILLSKLYFDLQANKTVQISGELTDPPGVFATEFRTLKEVLVNESRTLLVFDKELTNTYKRDSVTVNANVAFSTHGESVQEILGSGDATQAFQKFVLKQTPLTFTSADTPSGTTSSLTIRVNDILWNEVPSFYGKGPNEQIYITRQKSSGETLVMFGDGITGARLPSGEQNIRAFYRKGIGAEGILKANQLSMLVDRLSGLKAVTNPLETIGAQSPEQLAEARDNANLTIFTLDRIVSVQDCEDFARAFAGITKAYATWVWSGNKRSIHISVAGVDKNAILEEGDPVFDNLVDAIANASIPNLPVEVESYTKKLFHIEGTIHVKSEFIKGKVLTAVKTRLREHFSFENRKFGQNITKGEILAVIHQEKGVAAVDLDHLYETNVNGSVDEIIARISSTGTEAAIPAELIFLDDRPINLKTAS